MGNGEFHFSPMYPNTQETLTQGAKRLRWPPVGLPGPSAQVTDTSVPLCWRAWGRCLEPPTISGTHRSSAVGGEGQICLLPPGSKSDLNGAPGGDRPQPARPTAALAIVLAVGQVLSHEQYLLPQVSLPSICPTCSTISIMLPFSFTQEFSSHFCVHRPDHRPVHLTTSTHFSARACTPQRKQCSGNSTASSGQRLPPAGR